MNRPKLYLVALYLLVGLAFLLHRDYRADMDAAAERIAQGTQVTTACGQIEYAERGEGTPVLMIHGAGGGFDQGLLFASGLAEEGFRLISVSRFGYLGTPMPDDADPRRQADAHACLLDALELDRVAVVAGSAGSPSAVQLALRHPERVAQLALLVPVLADQASQPAVDLSPEAEALIELGLQADFLYWLAQRFVPGIVVEHILATPYSTVQSSTESEQQRVSEVLAHVLPVSARREGIGADRRMVQTLEPYPLEQISQPVMLVSAGGDGFGADRMARAAAARIPEATLVEFPDGGHLWIGHHRDLTDRLAEFLARPCC